MQHTMAAQILRGHFALKRPGQSLVPTRGFYLDRKTRYPNAFGQAFGHSGGGCVRNLPLNWLAFFLRGETARPGQTVTLEGRYSTRTDRNRRFRFRVRYLPLDCLAGITAGPELHLVSIPNCPPR